MYTVTVSMYTESACLLGRAAIVGEGAVCGLLPRWHVTPALCGKVATPYIWLFCHLCMLSLYIHEQIDAPCWNSSWWPIKQESVHQQQGACNVRVLWMD